MLKKIRETNTHILLHGVSVDSKGNISNLKAKSLINDFKKNESFLMTLMLPNNENYETIFSLKGFTKSWNKLIELNK